jgi:hypothetical protein
LSPGLKVVVKHQYVIKLNISTNYFWEVVLKEEDDKIVMDAGW